MRDHRRDDARRAPPAACGRGAMTSVSHFSPERLSAGTRPARTNDDLPTPELPTTAISGRSRMRVTIAAISRLRPKNLPASFSWNDDRPAYGLSSICSSLRAAAGQERLERARAARWRVCQRCSLFLSRQRSTIWISSRGHVRRRGLGHRRHRQLEHRGDDELVAVERMQRVAAADHAVQQDAARPDVASGDRSRCRCPTARGTCTSACP